jgi:hypothetical protein
MRAAPKTRQPLALIAHVSAALLHQFEYLRPDAHGFLPGSREFRKRTVRAVSLISFHPLQVPSELPIGVR